MSHRITVRAYTVALMSQNLGDHVFCTLCAVVVCALSMCLLVFVLCKICILPLPTYCFFLRVRVRIYVRVCVGVNGRHK